MAAMPDYTPKEVLQLAAVRFREYELHHARKSPPDVEKAERNGYMANLCERAADELRDTLGALDVGLARLGLNRPDVVKGAR